MTIQYKYIQLYIHTWTHGSLVFSCLFIPAGQGAIASRTHGSRMWLYAQHLRASCTRLISPQNNKPIYHVYVLIAELPDLFLNDIGQ